MIERKFVQQNIKRFRIEEFLYQELTRAGLSDMELQRTPLGDKIVIHASRPGLVVGKGGSNIKKLSKKLKATFDLDNPQIEIEEVKDPRDDATIIAEMIANNLERFGAGRFKGLGHKNLNNAMNAGALGAEIIISGKVPSSRARRWRFYQGYLKKCGEIAFTSVEEAQQRANLSSGAVGITVRIMHGDVELPDKITVQEPQLEELPMEKEDEPSEQEEKAVSEEDVDAEEAQEDEEQEQEDKKVEEAEE